MTTDTHHHPDRTGPFAALLIALSMALAVLSIPSIRSAPAEAAAVPQATPAPGFP